MLPSQMSSTPQSLRQNVITSYSIHYTKLYENLSLLNCNIINDEFGACGVAAQASNSMITNCTVTGMLSGTVSGGIVGQATLSTIKNCIVNANISGHLVSIATPETAGDEGA